MAFICLSFILLSPSSPSELKKEPSVLSVAKSQGKHGSASSPQPKFLTQHPLQKQGHNTDQSQDVQNRTANGVVAQNQLECRDSTLPAHNASTAIQNDSTLFDSSLVNGERDRTSTDSLETTVACPGQKTDNCCRMPSADMLPSGKETIDMIANTEDKQVEEHIKEDQHVETKVRPCAFCSIHTEKLLKAICFEAFLGPFSLEKRAGRVIMP